MINSNSIYSIMAKSAGVSTRGDNNEDMRTMIIVANDADVVVAATAAAAAAAAAAAGIGQLGTTNGNSLERAKMRAGNFCEDCL